MERRWGYGIWIGKRACSDEHFIAHEDGTIVRTSSVAALTLAESWSRTEVMNVKATPWNLTGNEAEEATSTAVHDILVERRGGPSTSRASTTMEPQNNTGVNQPEVPAAAPRGVHIKHSYLEKFGYTPGCIKCGDIQVGRFSDNKRGHSIDGRNGLRECLRKDEVLKEHLEKSEEKMDEYLAKQVEMEDQNTEAKKRRSIDEPAENNVVTPSTGSGHSGEPTTPDQEMLPTASGAPEAKRPREVEDDLDEQERPTHFQVTEYDSDTTDPIWGPGADHMNDGN